MKSTIYSTKIILYAEILFTGLSIYFLFIFLASSIPRLSLPYELTNYEFLSHVQVLRVSHFDHIYSIPSLQYVPMMYAPLYYYASVPFVILFGPSLFSLRLVSFIATICTMAVLYMIAKKETGSIAYGIIAAGFFAACYKIGGSSYEVARVDSLALMFFVMSIFFVRSDKFGHKYLIGGISFALACVTKQTYLLYLVPILLLIKPKRHIISFLFTSLLLIVVVAIGFHISSDGWFFYYVINLPSKQRLHEDIIGRIAQVAFVYKYFIGLFAVVLFSRMQKKIDRNMRLMIAAGVSIVISFILTLKNGGSNNMMFPAFGLVAIVLSQTVFKSLKDMCRVGFTKWNKHLAILISCVTFYSFFLYIPSMRTDHVATRKQWSEAVFAVHSIKGEVFIPSDPFLVYTAGKTPAAHIDLIGDSIGEWGDRQQTIAGENIVAELRSNVQKKKYSIIALTERDEKSIFIGSIRGDLEKNYRTEAIFIQKGSFFMSGLTFYTSMGYVKK